LAFASYATSTSSIFCCFDVFLTMILLYIVIN